MMKKVIGIGECCVDFVTEMDRIPQSDCCVEMLGSSWQGGGKVATALAAAGRLGMPAEMVSVVGDDPYGRFVREDLIVNGVGVDHIRVVPGAQTDLCVCLAERATKGRSFIGRFGRLPPLRPRDLDEGLWAGAGFLHLEAIDDFTLEAIGQARRRGAVTVMDADRYRPELEANLDKIDVFIGSEYYFQGMFAQKGALDERAYAPYLIRLKEAGPQVALITLGQRGCVGVDEGGFFHVPAFTQIGVRDTTGAGDVFHGGYIYAMARGMDARRAARYASAVSAIKCCAPGGRAGIPTARAVEDFLRYGRIDPEEAQRRAAYYQTAIFAR